MDKTDPAKRPAERVGMVVGHVKNAHIVVSGAESDSRDDGTLRVMVVGSPPPSDETGVLQSLPRCAFVEFEAISEALIRETAPDIVLSPLVSSAFDCMELALRLVEKGYRGRYRAFANRLPQPDMVQREIANIFPELDFAVLVVPSGS